MTQFIARSSYANIYIVKETGEITKIDYAAMGGTDEWDDIERFDPATLTSKNGEDDVNSLRFYGKDGEVYDPAEDEVEPEDDEMEEDELEEDELEDDEPYVGVTP